MDALDHLLLILLSVCGSILLIYTLKKSKLRYFLLSAFSGVAALIGADLIGGLFDFNLPLNALSVSLGAMGGLPGVILLNILTVFFR